MDSKGCSRAFLQGLLSGVILLVALAPPAQAQGGLGKDKSRPRKAPQEEKAAPREQAPKEEPAPGEYSLNGAEVIEAVNRGEGPQALAFFERAAKEAEQQGNLLRAARAWHAASLVTLRLGRYQQTIQSASRANEAFKKASGLSPQDQMSWVSSYSHLAAAYRLVRDLPKARQTLEEGLEYVKANISGRREGQAEGSLLNELATLAFVQKDYQTALARSAQAAQYFEAADARAGAKTPERQRQTLRRWAATAFLGVGRAQLALGHLDEADAAYAKGATYARLSGFPQIENQLLSGQANLALARKDWAKALGLYQQSIAIANQLNRARALPGLYQGQSRALEGLGRIDDALASAGEAVRIIEEIRADLTDSDLRSGFFEDKQGIYQRAVNLALQAQRPEEAFALSERSRSRTFLDLLGSQTTLSKGRTRALVGEEVLLRARLAEAKAEAQQSEGSEESARARTQAEAVDRDY
jgi:tetratricopeptide (TPR) repeat protein